MSLEVRPALPDEIGDGGADDSLVAITDGGVAGHLTADRVDVTVPGGARLTAAFILETHVDPDHTRRGVLTGLVHRLVGDARERGQVLAVIDAPAWPLFGKFGFGMATEHCAALIDARCTTPVHRATEEGFEALDAADVMSTLPAAHELAARDRVGSMGRSRHSWQRLADGIADSHAEVVVHRDSTSLVDGYMILSRGPGNGVVHELVGQTPEIERGLWAYLVTREDVGAWQAPRRPLDDVARLALADPRAYRTEHRCDGSWLRLLDLDVALGARTYGSTIANVTIRVDDPWYHANCGTWRIDSYGSFRSQATPELIVGIDMLSAVYLGAVSWQELRDAGRVIEQRSRAAHDADVLFGNRPLAFDAGQPKLSALRRPG